MPSLRYLIDTNVLVYAHDRRAATRRERAAEVLRRLHEAQTATLAAQVLAEFARVTLSKLAPTLAPEAVYRQVELFEDAFPVLPLTPAIVLEAVRGFQDHSFSYFDAQIWATAKLGQLPIVLSEDFPTGATVEGVTFVNPLAEDFDLAEL